MPALIFRVRVIGPSMEPGLRNGDLRWARKGGLRAGRIGVFTEPGRLDFVVVKRLIRRDRGGWWVEGDSPELSRDSRQYGVVPEGLFLGTLVRHR